MKFYEGPSQFRGSDESIQAVLTGYKEPSHNPKTGPVVQLHIQVRDINPVEAKRNGSDRAVCGVCPIHKECYVGVGRGELATWKKHDGVKAQFDAPEIMSRVGLRLGAYGDPAMLPEKLIRRLVAVANRFRPNHTGFTQRWRKKSAQWLRFFCMASVSSEGEALEAQRLGWRTYRVRKDSERVLDNEIVCPGAKEAGYRTTCQRCTLCDGMRSEHDRRKNISIVYHGNYHNFK